MIYCSVTSNQRRNPGFNEPVLDNGTVTCTGKDYAATTSVEVQLKDGTIITEAVSLDKATKLNMKVKDVESFSCEVIKL